ncbi:hypothetical protein [Streptomyces coerulescens]|uniref:Uncharacterized protein n=1 Tax=Streptomyces coerulescens TaxID=29304 RepID=A0ABW0CV26_STRCD|nr:hypothetical protein POD33_00015 [Streptomyces moderatus]
MSSVWVFSASVNALSVKVTITTWTCRWVTSAAAVDGVTAAMAAAVQAADMSRAR